MDNFIQIPLSPVNDEQIRVIALQKKYKPLSHRYAREKYLQPPIRPASPMAGLPSFQRNIFGALKAGEIHSSTHLNKVFILKIPKSCSILIMKNCQPGQ